MSSIAAGFASYRGFFSGAVAKRGPFWVFVAVVTALTVLVLTPLLPSLPIGGLDPSWRYATAYAAANKMAFGRDFVWTYGPFSGVSANVYEPRTFAFVVALAALFATALVLGFAALAPDNAALLLLLPVLAAQINNFDGIVASIGLVFLLVLSRNPEGGLQRATVLFMACLLGAAPNVKGSYLLLASIGGGSGVVLALRQSRRFAAAVALCGLAGLVLPWVAIGQRLADLPAFIYTQFVLMSGFSAMSMDGPAASVRIFWLSTAILLMVLITAVRSGRLLVAGSFLVFAFVVFKAGFVRQDGHMMHAGSFLMFSGLALCLVARSWLGVVPLLVGFCGGAAIERSVIDVHPSALLRATEERLHLAVVGLRSMRHFPEAYAQARQRLAQELPIQPGMGSVDVYTTETAPVLAVDGRWNPRPVFQSYQAYTPTLQRWNAEHLEGPRAPDTVFFRPDGVDGRYPALEDALSWPVLRARYTLVGIENGFAVLRKRDTPLAVSYKQPLGESEAQIGQPVAVPSGAVWATINVEPSWRGRLLDVVFRPSPLQLVVDYDDGSQRSFRFLPAIGRSGFLLSPTVENSVDFAAVWSAQKTDPPRLAIRSVRVVSPNQPVKDWKADVKVRFFRFAVDDASATRGLDKAVGDH